MANDSRSGSKTKDHESHTKKNLVNGKGYSSSGSVTNDTSGLRRLVRETSLSKQMTLSPPSTRKSERLVKRMPVSPLITRKSERMETRTTISPSDSGKKHTSSSSSSGSNKSEKRSGSPDMKWMKGKRMKSLKQLSVEAKEVTTSEYPKSACGKRKKMDASNFKALLRRRRRRIIAADGNGIKASNRGGIVEKTLADAEKLLVDFSAEERLQTPELVGSASAGKSLGDGIDMETNDNSIPSKRKRDQMVMYFDTSATDGKKCVCTLSSDDVYSPSVCKTYDVFGTCVACSKRQRVDHDSQRQDSCSCSNALSKDLHETNIYEDSGRLEASAPTEPAEKFDGRTQLKDISRNILTDVNENSCVICKLGGKLMCCNGKDCKRSYHLSCLDPPLDGVPPGVWHCLWCVSKEIQASAYPVCEGVESIWDVREIEVSDAEGWKRCKQYFVKYRGVAHVHNQWVQESLLLLEAQELIEEFNKKGQVVKWNEEWAVPQRLLKKRLLSSAKQINEYPSDGASEISSCRYEWLVKWRGLDYENATWELENSSFLSSVHGQNLIMEYENCQKNAKQAANIVNKDKNVSLVKLSKLPVGSPLGIDTSHLDTINKLREFWHKGQSAVVFDDQDRIIKIILYIISLSDVCQPFLIVTSSDAVYLWEAEFLRVARSIDIVLYSGSRDNRRIIRTLEFYHDGGGLMSQVLLSTLEAVVEDLEFLESLKWEAVIVDECEQPRVSNQYEKIKMLATDVKVLLFSSPIKDSITEYLNLLSLLNCRGDLANIDGSKTESNDDLCKLKERLAQYIACERYSKFVEFWVPSQISNVQLEQYCAALLSNSISLCSCAKIDPVGALRNMLLATRKCCDHPYILDPSLKSLITKDLPAVNFLDVEIKASGKLQLLEVILSEMKIRQLRALVLFQSIGGSGRDSLGLGDILDDFLRERFGPDSYERVDGGAISSKRRQAALNNFNKESGRFVFLLENRACLPSIRLSAVDTIVIFDSDWNPANDVRALQKISIDSRIKQIKIFRLYSSFTVEEKVLILAKQGLPIESKLQNISRTTSDMLLKWGASYLFNRLDEFHITSDANISPEQSLLNKVVMEFLTLLSQSGESNQINNSIIIKVQRRGGVYSSNLKLLGELQDQLSDKEHQHGLWTNLLEGRNPRWKYLAGKTQRHRKKVKYFGDSPKKPEGEIIEVGKKRKKGVANFVNLSSLKAGLKRSQVAGIGGGASGIPADNESQYVPRSDTCEIDTFHTSDAAVVESEERILPNVQKSLHLLFKPDISKLCKILNLSDGVKLMVGWFLEYVIVNCRVNQITREPATTLQAFLISLCWTAASLLKQKVDRRKSLALAKHHLNFSCSEEQADCMYSKMRSWKKIFKENNMESNFSKDSIAGAEDITKGSLNGSMPQPAPCNLQNIRVEDKQISRNQEYTDERVLSRQAQAQAPHDVLQPEKAPNGNTAKEDKQKCLEVVQRNCKKRMMKLLQNQQRETEEFHRDYEDRRAVFENKHRVESAIIREMYIQIPLRMNKLRVLDNHHAKKMEELERDKELGLNCLEAKHLSAINDEKQKAARWFEAAKLLAIEDRGQHELSLHGSLFENQVKYSQATENRPCSGSENEATVSKNLIEQRCPGGIAPDDTHDTVLNHVVGCSIPNETLTVPVYLNSKDDVENSPSDNVSVTISQGPNGVGGLVNVSENIVPTNQHCSHKQLLDGILLRMPCEMAPPELPERLPNEAVSGAESVETGTPAVETNGENGRSYGVSSGAPNTEETHNNEANCSISGDSPSEQLSLLKPPFTHPTEASACDCSLSQNLVLPHECSQSLVSTNMQDEYVRVEVPSLQTDQSNHDSSFLEPREHIEQLQQSLSTNSPLGDDQPDIPLASGSAHEPLSEGDASSQSVKVSCQLAENPAELSDQVVLLDHQRSGHSNSSFRYAEAQPQVVEDSALPDQVIPHIGANMELDGPINATEIPLRHNQHDVLSASRLDHQPSGELNTSFLNAEALPQVVEGTAELPNEAIIHSGLNLSIIRGSDNLTLHSELQIPSRIPSLPSYSDPLQNELERIRKETERASKVHEDMKLRLKSELDEIVAQLRRNYEAKLKDVEAEFLMKKNELVANHNKALMSKIVADAFQSKCLGIGHSRPMGMQQVAPPGFTQHLHQLPVSPAARPPSVTVSSPPGLPAVSQQNTALQLQPAPRVPSVSVLSSAGQPAANQQSMAPQLQHASRLFPGTGSSSAGQPAATQQNMARQLQPAPRFLPVSVSSSTGQPAATHHSTAPALQIVHESAAIFSSSPTRPPQIHPITPLTVNLRVNGDIRAPAPHIKPFRSASTPGITFTSLPPGMVIHPTPSSLQKTSHSLPHEHLQY